MNKVCFVIPRVPSSLNRLNSLHWAIRRKAQSFWKDHVFAAWIKQNKCVFLTPVKITYVLTFTSKRTRDEDNYIGGTKPITDALKRTFIFRDDAEWVKSVHVEFRVGIQESTLVIIEEAKS